MPTWLYTFESLPNMKIKVTVVFMEMYEMGLEGTNTTVLIEFWHRTMKRYIVM